MYPGPQGHFDVWKQGTAVTYSPVSRRGRENRYQIKCIVSFWLWNWLSHYYYYWEIPVNFLRTSSPIKLHANRTSAIWRLSNTLSGMSMLIHLCISFHNDVIISFLVTSQQWEHVLTPFKRHNTYDVIMCWSWQEEGNMDPYLYKMLKHCDAKRCWALVKNVIGVQLIG